MKMETAFETDGGRFLIRPYGAGDEPGVLSLWQAAFHKELSPTLWRWKYLENPYPQKVLVCTREDGTMVALFGGIPYRAMWEGRPIEILHAMDIMSHPDYRGGGLFVRTCLAFMDIFCQSGGIGFLYGLPGRYHYDLGERYLGYRELTGCLCFLTVRTVDLMRGRKRFGARLRRISDVDNSFDRLWRKCSGHYPLAVIRDARFLRWRFMNNPGAEYAIYGYQRWPKGDMLAYAVLSRNHEKTRLVDIIAPPDHDLIQDFLGRIGLELAKQGIETVETWLPSGHFISRAAHSCGFAPLREPLGVILCVRLFDHSPSLKWITENIFLTMADGDLM